MAHHKSAKKRIKVSEKKRTRNKQYLAKVRTAIKSFRLASSGDTDGKVGESSDLAQMFRSVQSLLAKACSKGIVHKNTAARKIQRLHLLLKKSSATR